MKSLIGIAVAACLIRPGAAQTVLLSAAQVELAQWVQVGTMPCELGQSVVLVADPLAMGFFSLQIGRAKYRVAPELTTTGAIRLEDKVAGIVWLQLANKSMLMNQKLGRRLADECKSAAQQEVAKEMLRNPPASVLDEPKPAVAVSTKPEEAVSTKPADAESTKPADAVSN